MGSLISKAHQQKVLDYIQQGMDAGAHLRLGGHIKHIDRCPNGAFVAPTVFTQCADEMAIVQEEIFGPVACILSFRDDEEVLQRANATPFGLASGVFTQNINQGHYFASQLNTGTVWINQYNVTPIEVPFGGNKLSGFGRENSLAAIDHYTQLKTTYLSLNEVENPF